MPYVSPDEALNLMEVDIEAVSMEMGPPPWRRPLVATPAVRCVLLQWPAGYVTVPHWHPFADEVFRVVAGRASFRFGNEAEGRIVGPGSLLTAPRGVKHTIAVAGDEPMTLLATVTPNEDRPGETIEEL
jgi:mannose-6-phosphate isomerase-like protein (cupin superfamily)